MKSLIVALAVLGMVVTEVSLACSCMRPGRPSQELARASAVLSGRATKIVRGEGFRGLKVTLEVDRVWKGARAERVEISTASHGAACGVHFEEGTSYLVYAFLTRDKALTTNLCSRTRPLSAAREDLEELGRGEVPTKG